MKKIIALLVTVMMLISSTACSKNSGLNNINFDIVNYNNLYDTFLDSRLCINGDTIFYNSDGFYNQRTFVRNNGKKTKLIEHNDFSNESYYGDFFVIDGFMYFNTFTETEPAGDYIYRYSLAEQKYEKLLSTTNLSFWLVTKEHIVFSKFGTEDDICDLYIYNMQSKTETLVAENVLEFGIANNKLRYLTQATDDNIFVYETDFYGRQSQKLGEFTTKIQDYPIFNFTTNYVVSKCTQTENESSISVYSTQGKYSEYSLPRPVQQLICGDEYAYAVCFEYQELSSDIVRHKDNGIYRINLSNGNYKKIDSVTTNNTEVHVNSDNEIYIIKEAFSIAMYRRNVYKMDVNENTKRKIFVW